MEKSAKTVSPQGRAKRWRIGGQTAEILSVNWMIFP